MHARFFRFLSRRAALAGAVGLAACAAPGAPLPAGSGRPALRLGVGTVAFVDGPPPLERANFIDERRTRELAEAVRSRLDSRLLAEGGPARLRIRLEQVALTERLIEGRQGGFTGLVAREATYAQEAAVAVRLLVEEEGGRELAQARVAVQRARPQRAGTSVVARDAAARVLARDLLEQLDDALEVAVQENLGPWLQG